MLRVTQKEAKELRKRKKEVIRTKRGYYAVETKGLIGRLKSINEGEGNGNSQEKTRRTA
jgi:hypothetical protein